eukprot:CAMPEP_0177765840 /NCGR_PEP_ID=MMETSP0491_2-20121128/8201_1 /TAXON_ID=63592 /ORGANISM="Tetraselmis chuii, Strain PLY429" /LENGTH=310 /DNA_ID=CAMNT_0019282205 /DNA_START=334 /DNA_END=1263 /DNA_ORIENTATION=+
MIAAFTNPYESSSSGANDAQRQQHITELVSQISAALPVAQNRSKYEVPFALRNGTRTALLVTLPPRFPMERPALSLQHGIPDPWVDASGWLMFDALRRWKHPQSRLVEVVKEALAHFTAPPQPPPPPMGAQQQQQQEPPPLSAMTVPDSFPSLADKPTAELVKLLRDPKAYEALVKAEVAKLDTGKVIAEAKQQNVKLAQRNLEMETKFREVKNQIAIVRSSEYGATKQAFDDRAARQAKVAEELQPEKLIRALEEKGAQLEEESDELYSEFMSENIPVDAFVDKYMKLRTEVNERLSRRQAAQIGQLMW